MLQGLKGSKSSKKSSKYDSGLKQAREELNDDIMLQNSPERKKTATDK